MDEMSALETTITIPSLETERLLMRAFCQQDLDPFTKMVADPQVMELATYSGKLMNRSQADNWLCMMVGHWHLRGFGIWAVEEKNSGSLIGRIGLQRLIWFEETELVWMLSRSSWGKGYAFEGASAAVKFGFEKLGLARLSAVIHPENHRSIKLAERLGMKFIQELDREGIRFYEYQIMPPGAAI
ncbi:MAG: GNAT family N-acetyltransferase [Anaerolineales bacterium]